MEKKTKDRVNGRRISCEGGMTLAASDEEEGKGKMKWHGCRRWSLRT